MNSTPSSVAGFNLTELMVVVAVAGILAAIALPSFTSLSQSQQVKNASFDLYALITVARSEAIKRNSDVTIAPVMAGGKLDRIDVTAADGTLLRSKSAPKNVGIYTSAAGVTYKRTGRTATGATVTLQLDVAGTGTGGVSSPPTAHVRCITLGLGGRPGIRKGAC